MIQEPRTRPIQNFVLQEKEEIPNTEVVAKAKRKRFTAAEKLCLLREVEACRDSGDIGALLRREGIYSSYLSTWRKQREDGELDSLAQQKRGPKPNLKALELAKLRREHARLQERMRRAELITDVQKKSRRCLASRSRRRTWTIRVDCRHRRNWLKALASQLRVRLLRFPEAACIERV